MPNPYATPQQQLQILQGVTRGQSYPMSVMLGPKAAQFDSYNFSNDQSSQLIRMLLEAIAANQLGGSVGPSFDSASQRFYGSAASQNPYQDLLDRYGSMNEAP